MKSSKTKSLIQVATARKKADLVIENCNVVNVFSQEIICGKLAISQGIFIGIGDYEATEIIDGEGKYIVPGLIDSHVHIESSMGSPYQFARAVLPRGTTTVISDCHEIANVKGLEGIKYMIESSNDLETVSKGHEELNKIAMEQLGINENVNAFMTLAFMALPVIPKLKITDKGLFDVIKFELTSL
ncbi:adenine deaminase C-terminal domain-containing protein [Clostridium tagluense]|uniref:Adenine deaminase C-terminal domain-containing protein n=1 Tax=Clostridium tagluense TaxID=360422 RepID=A0A401UKV5_9CLOT|nr:hypothetical protein Ctaglu_18040 [Clostridium tagluense]